MKFIADLHIHSRFSRATSRQLDLEHLYTAAQVKGITVVGTGDFTHPGWFADITEKLEPAEPGLYRLKNTLARECDRRVPARCRRPVRFMLQCEISNIYKKADRTRKNHNLVFMPDLNSAAAFNARLDAIGNIHSDGRPILGLDSRDLLDIVLNVADDGFLVPAHIWTPWFSLFGSKSGFDDIEACFEDLTEHVFALETGLSSDPPMNWRVSALDRYTLISNSDAHSPAKLGREANLFDTDLSYHHIRSALDGSAPGAFCGTIEFYPEEGKYHLDGHRNCKVRMTPSETIAVDGICPECGKALTLGVSHRVDLLADRKTAAPPAPVPYHHLVPLTDILSEIYRVGPGSKKVAAAYDRAIDTLGSELDILNQLPTETIDLAGIPLLSEAISRMRDERMVVEGGYDGQFGTIHIFSDDEYQRLMGQRHLFKSPEAGARKKPDPKVTTPPPSEPSAVQRRNPLESLPMPPKETGLNPMQRQAVTHDRGPLMIIAGPGSGKTLTITRRIAHLVDHQGVAPSDVLAVTFTHKAASEMTRRLKELLSADQVSSIEIGTFHRFCYRMLSSHDRFSGRQIIDDDGQSRLLRYSLSETGAEHRHAGRPARLKTAVSLLKQHLIGVDEQPGDIIDPDDAPWVMAAYERYQTHLDQQGLMDFDDLIGDGVRLLTGRLDGISGCPDGFTHVLVDEFQDINTGQYQLLRALVPADGHLCVIGDPDQSIYGFRGSDSRYFDIFQQDYPGAAVIRLDRNYRSTATILDAAYQVVAGQRIDAADHQRVFSDIRGADVIDIVETDSEKAEAVAIGKQIEQLIGGTGFQAIDFGAVDGMDGHRSFSDFAVLFRTHQQGRVLAEVFSAAGIPFQQVRKTGSTTDGPVPELMALLRLSGGGGCLDDIAVCAGSIHPGISTKTVEMLREWCFQNGIQSRSLRYTIHRYPVDHLSPYRQQRLYAFLGRVFEMAEDMAPLAVDDKLRYLLDHSRIGSRVSDDPGWGYAVDRLIGRATAYGHRLSDFLADSALVTDTDDYDERAEKVALMTLHAAKGLEFPVVFICGCEDGLMPYRYGATEGDPHEERRLLFVGMTRAREKLIITHARHRRIHGNRCDQSLSPFILDIDSRLRCHGQHRAASVNPGPEQSQLSLF